MEAYYTTGRYSIFMKVMTPFHRRVADGTDPQDQTIDEIQSTETLISLQNPILQDVKP